MWEELSLDQDDLTNVKELPWLQLCAEDEQLNTHYLALQKSQSLVTMVWAAWLFGLAIANQLLSQELTRRASFEKHSPLVKQMPLIIGADGVMVPIRPQEKTPKGQTIWREVKVAILARLEHRINSKGKPISQLHHRRLVAVLGDIESLKPRLWLEALRCGFRDSTVAWLSDGGRG